MPTITVRCTDKEKEKITKNWKKAGFTTESEYIRFVALNARIEVRAEK